MLCVGSTTGYDISVEEAYLVERVRLVSRGNRNRPIGDEFGYERGYIFACNELGPTISSNVVGRRIRWLLVFEQ